MSSTNNSHEDLLRKKRKKALFNRSDLAITLNYSREDIEKIIPHRAPMLFVDKITSIDLEKGLIAGERYLDPQDPVFQGHFPDVPIYPGNFTLEMVGQLALCMNYFEINQRTDIAPDAEPAPSRLTKVSSYYLEPVHPGTTVTLLAQRLHIDSYTMSLIAQALVDDKVALCALGQAVIL